MNENHGFDEKLMEAARSLEKDVAPERDLWPEIASAITAPSRSPWSRIVAQAAVVVLLVAASSGVTYLLTGRSATNLSPVATTEGLRLQQASFGDQYVLGADYQDARDALEARLDDDLNRLPPETRAEVEKNLDAIRAAIEEINRALSYDPDSSLLQELLLSAYQDELELMKKIDGIANAAMVRNDI